MPELFSNSYKIDRKSAKQELRRRLGFFPATALLGARQCGKTHLARELGADYFFDLENPADLIALEEARLTLSPLKGLIAIDEVQRRPELFSVLRHLVDTHTDQRYLLLGSASRDLIHQSSESMAGRISYFDLSGFLLEDIDSLQWRNHWLRGGFPRSFLAPDDGLSYQWRLDYIRTYLERDIPQLGITIPSGTLGRFWSMIAHGHGQLLNAAELGRNFGIVATTVRNYLDILQSTFMVRLLQPWHTNGTKREVKAPKVYLRDTGLLHSLLQIYDWKSLATHPILGASWEGYALEQTLAILPQEVHPYFWATHAGAELDLFFEWRGKRYGVEFKYTDSPSRTRSMTIAFESLQLEHLWVVCPEGRPRSLGEGMEVVSIATLDTIRSRLF